MKDIIYRFFTVAIILLVVGCGEDQYDPSKEYSLSTSLRYLRVPETSFRYESSSAHQVDFIVEAMETQWGFSNSNDWISLSPETGKETTTVTMNIQENPFGDESRIGLFELLSLENDWMYSKALTVSQMASSPYLNVEEDYLYFDGGNEQQEILIESNCNWTTSVSPNWISLTKDATGTKLNISVSPNPEKNYRTGTFYIKYKDSSKQIKVYQYPSTITASDASLSFENTASEVALSLTAEADWTASVSDSWISVNPSNGTVGTHEVKISVAPNTTVSDRKGYVSFFTSGNKKAQIEIEQRGLYLETDIAVLEFSTSREETLPLKVISNTSWKVKSYPVWLSLSVLNGAGNATIEVTTNDNPIVDSRSGNIVITQEGLDLSCEMAVTQVGKAFELSAPYMEFPHNASSQTLKLRSELPWTSFVAGEWILTNPQSGITDADVTVSVLENNSYDEREGNVTYMVDGKSMVLSVHQQPKYFTIEDKVFDFTSKGGKVNISFSTNEKWTATIENEMDWLSLSQTSGEGDGNIQLSVFDNPSVNSRSAVVIIHTGTGRSYQFLIFQSARFLKVDTQSLMFFMEGGTSDAILVNTDGEYDIIPSAEWIRINRLMDSYFTVTTPLYAEDDSRQGSITIKMKELIDGNLFITIPVIQNGRRFVFKTEGYSADVNWNVTNEKEGLDLVIKGYTTDDNWNSNQPNGFSINREEYKPETNWNSTTEKEDSINIGTFKDDVNWNQLSEGRKVINKVDYNKDVNWNN